MLGDGIASMQTRVLDLASRDLHMGKSMARLLGFLFIGGWLKSGSTLSQGLHRPLRSPRQD